MEWLIVAGILLVICGIDWAARRAMAEWYVDQYVRRVSEAFEKQRQAREACKEAQRIARNQERTK